MYFQIIPKARRTPVDAGTTSSEPSSSSPPRPTSRNLGQLDTQSSSIRFGHSALKSLPVLSFSGSLASFPRIHLSVMVRTRTGADTRGGSNVRDTGNTRGPTRSDDVQPETTGPEPSQRATKVRVDDHGAARVPFARRSNRSRTSSRQRHALTPEPANASKSVSTQPTRTSPRVQKATRAPDDPSTSRANTRSQ